MKGRKTKDFRQAQGLLRRAFVFVLCSLSFVLGADAAPKFAITPYLQRPATDAMTIIFFTDSACNATVTCGSLATNTMGVWAQALTNNVKNSERSAWNNQLHKHRVRFENLKPNRLYDYTVKLDGGATYSNTFRTAPNRDTPIRFVSYGDCETAPAGSYSYTSTSRQNYTENLSRMVKRQPDFFALAGDYTARGGMQTHWDEFWKQNAGGGGVGYGDPAGGIPILAAIGNHDLFDQASHTSGYYHDAQGEVATEKILSYFEHNTNGVPYDVRDGTNIPETRDMSQLFHREDYGPVTLIFLDSNNGDDSDYNRDSNWCKSTNASHQPGGMDRNKGARHPDFNPGSPQYDWLTNQLADAQEKSRFTFVFNHHCPYSKGNHNRPPNTKDDEDASAVPLRVLTETMVRYGVDGWYCGHDELLEHSITNGYEILKDGSKRKHTLSIYDLGSSGDGARTSGSQTNPLEYNFMGNYGGSGNYGFLETDVTTNKNGQWTCTITPVQGESGDYVSGAQIVYLENQERGQEENDLVYAEHAKTKPIDGVSATKPSDWLPWIKPPESSDDPEPPKPEPTVVTNLTMAVGDTLVLTNHFRKNLRYWLLGPTGENPAATVELSVPMSFCTDYAGYVRRSTVKTNEVLLTIKAVKPGEESISLGRQYKLKNPVRAADYRIVVR